MVRLFFITLIIIFIVAISFIVLSLVLPGKEFIIENQRGQLASLTNLEPKDSKITIFTVGDIMLDRGVELKIKKEGKGDFRFPFFKIAGELKKADILFGNLEGPISDKGQKVGSIYSFRFDPKAIEGLKYAGFDIFSLANNHMFDYQRIALEDTMRILEENKIDYVGAGFSEEEAFSLKIREIKNTKIGFLAYTNLGPEVWKATEKNSGIAWISEKDIEEVKRDIERAKQKIDILIVSLHSGEEYATNTTPFQISFARAFVDAGADLIVGHHPHIIQKIERYKNSWIAYSLGNFIFDQSFSEETMEGLLLEVIIEDNKIKELNPKEIKISKSFQPYLEKDYNPSTTSSHSSLRSE